MNKEFKKYADSSDSSDSEDYENNVLLSYCYFCGGFVSINGQQHYGSEKHIKKVCKFINSKDEMQSIKEFCESYLKTNEGMATKLPHFDSIDMCFNSHFRQQIYTRIKKSIDNQIICALIASNINKTNNRAAICSIIQNIFE